MLEHILGDGPASRLFHEIRERRALAYSVGSALSLSKQLLENADRGAKDRVVVLISDGEDLSGEITDNLAALKDAGIKIPYPQRELRWHEQPAKAKKKANTKLPRGRRKA